MPVGGMEWSYLFKPEKLLFSERLNRLHALVWTLGGAVLITLTVLDFLPLLADYKDNNVATHIGVVKNESVARPNATVCLPYPSGALDRVVDWINRNEAIRRGYDDQNETGRHTADVSHRCLECEALENHSWDVWTTMVDSSGEPGTGRRLDKNAISTALIKKLIQEADFSEWLRLDRSNFNWNEAIFDAIWRFFACVSHQDINFAAKDISVSATDMCGSFNFSHLDTISPENIDQMFEHVLDIVDLYLEIELVTEDDVVMESIKDRKHALAIKGEYFCIAMHTESQREVFTFAPFAEETAPPWKRSVRPDHFGVFEDDTVLYAFARRYTSVYPSDQRATNSESRSYEDVAVSYAVDTRVVERRPNIACDEDGSPVGVCLARRQLARAVKHCGCVPYIYRYLGEGNRSMVDEIDDQHRFFNESSDQYGGHRQKRSDRYRDRDWGGDQYRDHDLGGKQDRHRDGNGEQDRYHDGNDDQYRDYQFSHTQYQRSGQERSDQHREYTDMYQHRQKRGTDLYQYFDNQNRSLPYCNSTHYSVCADKLQEKLETYKNQCRHQCAYTFYKWKHFSRAANVRNSSRMFFRINITGLSDPFVEFQVTIKDSPEKFLSQIGGLVNLYLGFSGMSLCAFVILCIDRIKKRYRSKSDRRPESRLEPRESAVTHFGWSRNEHVENTRQDSKRGEERATEYSYKEKNWSEEIEKVIDAKIDAGVKKMKQDVMAAIREAAKMKNEGREKTRARF